jgi:HK97 family phage major capsid protein
MPEAQRATFIELRDGYNAAVEAKDNAVAQYEEALESTPPADAEERDKHDEHLEELKTRAYDAIADCEHRNDVLQKRESLDRAKSQFTPLTTAQDKVVVREPDLYVKGGRSFFADMYQAQMNNDTEARKRLDRHNTLEVEKRAITSTVMGGLIPPAYLIGLYAKAARNGRVLADQVNNMELPDTGMSVIIPRITTPSAAGVQATENTAATTQDIVETDLTINVRTLAGYLPVSRQALERAAYDDRVLFEDLTARYWALLDSQAISGSGAAGQLLGILNTAGISTSTASTNTIAGVWPKIADVIQQINTAMGGIGYVADKIVMHPRRWGFFEAAVDTQNRPLFGIQGQPAVNVLGEGNTAGYGLVGYMHGLPVYTDANIATNLGVSTNEDRIIVMASQVVHLWERGGDPVTLSFEQQAGTSLQVQLVCYGYAAFTAGRYPAATGVVSGAGLGTPTF